MKWSERHRTAFNTRSCQLFSSEREEHERFFFIKEKVTLRVAKDVQGCNVLVTHHLFCILPSGDESRSSVLSKVSSAHPYSFQFSLLHEKFCFLQVVFFPTLGQVLYF